MERVAEPTVSTPSSVPAALRLLAGGLFAYAGYLKAVDPAAFATELQNYRLLPTSLVASLAHYLPWLELVCAGAVFIAPMRRGAWLLLAVLGVGFVVFTTSAYLRGLDISCGCFGAAQARPIDSLTLARTGAILALTLAGFALDRVRPGREAAD